MTPSVSSWCGGSVRRKSSQALALRSRIVLKCAEGRANKEVAAECGVSPATVGKWRRRFCELRLDGLSDDPRPGRPATITAKQVEEVLVATLGVNAGERDALVAVQDGRALGAVGVDDRSDLAGVRAGNRTAPTRSSSPTTRCSWRRSTTSSACT